MRFPLPFPSDSAQILPLWALIIWPVIKKSKLDLKNKSLYIINEYINTKKHTQKMKVAIKTNLSVATKDNDK